MNQAEKLILEEIRGFFLDESERICQNQKNFNKGGIFYQYFGHFLTVTASLFSDLQPVVFRFFSISA